MCGWEENFFFHDILEHLTQLFIGSLDKTKKISFVTNLKKQRNEMKVWAYRIEEKKNNKLSLTIYNHDNDYDDDNNNNNDVIMSSLLCP